MVQQYPASAVRLVSPSPVKASIRSGIGRRCTPSLANLGADELGLAQQGMQRALHLRSLLNIRSWLMALGLLALAQARIVVPSRPAYPRLTNPAS